MEEAPTGASRARPEHRKRPSRHALLPLLALAGALLVTGLLLVPTRTEAAGPAPRKGNILIHVPLLSNEKGRPTPMPSQTPASTATSTSIPTLTSTPTATATNTALPTETPTATPSPVSPPLNTSHAGRFTAYEGSKTCMTCHLQETKDAHGSLHYQWNGPAPSATGLTDGGKFGALNDFCGYPDINWLGVLTNLDGKPTDGGCATCHAGMGARPSKDQTQAQLENVDCLTCHSETYKRKVVNDGGTFKLVPAPERMTVPLLQAITDIKEPTKANCLSCHVGSGGGPNNKRGDIEPALADPPFSFDVHMASQANGGQGFTCQSCHITQDHKIAGRGSDMRATDLDVPVRCTNCHEQQPHDDSRLDKHTAKIECSVCHIPTFAKVTSTDMFRDFEHVEVYEARRLYEPKITRGANVIPQYAWFNGTSTFYEFGDPITYGPSGRVEMSKPNGDINDPNAKLFGFKYHQASQAYDPVSGRILPLKMGILFQDGDIPLAIQEGAKAVGWELPQGWLFAPTERLLSINHGVAPDEEALRCDTCHGNDATRMAWDKLGYTPKETRNGKPLCESCHGRKDKEWDNYFYGVHEKHVTDKSIACSECHNFSR